ncbi:MAG: hypothetical protein ACU0C9_14280 [Paracoccaceae bacterium]
MDGQRHDACIASLYGDPDAIHDHGDRIAKPDAGCIIAIGVPDGRRE